jgi:hypothetical protein
MAPEPPQRGTSPGEEFGRPRRNNRWVNPNVAAAETAATFGFAERFSGGPPRIIHRGWCLAEGVPGAFPEGVPPDHGNPRRRKPGDWELSRGVNPPYDKCAMARDLFPATPTSGNGKCQRQLVHRHASRFLGRQCCSIRKTLHYTMIKVEHRSRI